MVTGTIYLPPNQHQETMRCLLIVVRMVAKCMEPSTSVMDSHVALTAIAIMVAVVISCRFPSRDAYHSPKIAFVLVSLSPLSPHQSLLLSHPSSQLF